MRDTPLERERMRDALGMDNFGNSVVRGEAVEAAIRSAVRAVLPGRQQKGNLGPYVELARKAFLRTLRRRAK